MSGMSGRADALISLVHFFDRAADHLIARNVFVGIEDVAGFVVAVDMRGNKIERHVRLLGVC